MDVNPYDPPRQGQQHKASARRRFATTLVEKAFIVFIVGILLSLFIPAVEFRHESRARWRREQEERQRQVEEKAQSQRDARGENGRQPAEGNDPG